MIRRDPIYQLVEISRESCWIIETPVFQRLKEIRQLGALDLVFPGASNRRFEHSIGVAFLARQTGQALRRFSPEIPERAVLQLEWAGLCHDLGHGPFSHVFDRILRSLEIEITEHEDRSCVLVRWLFAQRTDLFTAEDINNVCYMIHPRGRPPPTLIPGLEGIVNNPVHKMDVDKMDYLLRDAHYMRSDGFFTSLDILGLLDRSRLIDGHWVFHLSDHGTIYELVCRRHLFHTNRYGHPQVCAVSMMLEEILREYHLRTQAFTCVQLNNEDGIRDFIQLDDRLLENLINSSEHPDLQQQTRDLLTGRWYRHLTDSITQLPCLDESRFAQFSWSVYQDQSSPLHLIPKVSYYQNGKILTLPEEGLILHRLFTKKSDF